MGISKITFNGRVLMDISTDTVKDIKLLKSTTAHAADGEQIEGAYDPGHLTGFHRDENGIMSIRGYVDDEGSDEGGDEPAAIDYNDLINKPDLSAFVTKGLSDLTDLDVGNGDYVEKASHIENLSINSNNFTIRDCSLSGKLDLSKNRYSTHGIIDNIHFVGSGEALDTEGIYLNRTKDSDQVDGDWFWTGSLRISNVFTGWAKFPFTFYSNDTTDTFFSGLTVEGYQQAFRTNTELKIQNSYFGDNGFTDSDGQIIHPVDTSTPDCAFLLKFGAKVDVSDSCVGVNTRPGLTENALIIFDSSESSPAEISLSNCRIVLNNQYYDSSTSSRSICAIANVNNANDRVYIDDCLFDLYPKRVNNNHCRAPYRLKPFKTVYSKHPFHSYICGGKLFDIGRSFPASSANVSAYTTSSNYVNPFGGKLVNIGLGTTGVKNATMYYSIPDELVGKTMYIHAYVIDNGGAISNFRINRDFSDISETGGYWFNNNPYIPHSDVLANLVVVKVTPTKKIGRIVISAGSGDNGCLAGLFMVEQHNHYMLCDYEIYDDKIYSKAIPTYTPPDGARDVVWSMDPADSSCDGWKYNGSSWSAFNL